MITKAPTKQVNDLILSTIESDKVLHSKMYTKSTHLKNEIIGPIKEIFAVISKKFKSLMDACKKEEKDLQISCSAAETAYSLQNAGRNLPRRRCLSAHF